MFDCNHLLHPFQNDPGTSQRQRVIDSLLSESVKIDGRTLADLLNYFVQLSPCINYYDQDLSLSDWQPFFRKSIPFLLVSINKYDVAAVNKRFTLNQKLFDKEVSVSGLQLLLHFVFNSTISKIDEWWKALQGTDLSFTRTLEQLIRERLAGNLKEFISLANLAAKYFCIRRLDFSQFVNNADSDVWSLEFAGLYCVSEQPDWQNTEMGSCEKISDLYERIVTVYQHFIEAIGLMANPAADSINDSLVPVGVELQKNHAPHLAIIFAFIRLFQKMQLELNKKTRAHLKFFYTDVLKIKPREEVADEAHIVFELQKILQDQYEKFRIDASTALNGGRDKNNADIIFKTKEEIIVNETQIAEVRTLYLNNQKIIRNTFLEGAYIAPAANKADGVNKDFKDGDPNNWYTIGNKYSKYTEPGKEFPKLHPSARLGFALASPVLFLSEGKRTVNAVLACNVDVAQACSDLSLYEVLQSPVGLYNMVNAAMASNYYLVSEDLINAAVENGMDSEIADLLRTKFLQRTEHLCYAPLIRRISQASVIEADWLPAFSAVQLHAVAAFFKKKRPLKISLSGEKEWIEVDSTAISQLELTPNPFGATQCHFNISFTLEADIPAVKFYNKDVLGEDLNTTLPLMKVELEDWVKLWDQVTPPLGICCLEKDPGTHNVPVSLYHFFRALYLDPANNATTKINVTVCGLKNFLVQNDENVMDVNSIIFPFTTRPKLGANFIISSKEIFCKHWTEIGIRFSWKDKPDFKTYYHGYEDYTTGLAQADFDENNYFYQPYFLQNGLWRTGIQGKLFFSGAPMICGPLLASETFYHIQRGDFGLPAYTPAPLDAFQPSPYTNSSRDYFLRLSLVNIKNQTFQHDRYSYVLARQMMALGKWPEIYVGPVYDGIPNPPPLGPLPTFNVDDVFKTIERSYQFATNISARTSAVLAKILAKLSFPAINDTVSLTIADFRDAIQDPEAPNLLSINVLNPANYPAGANPINPGAPELDPFLLRSVITELETSVLLPIYNNLQLVKDKRVVIPNEPYTPQIQGMGIDYIALAEIRDIKLIHLYPFANTHKQEEIELGPPLFPTFCDEGSLFIGLDHFQPGINLNLLFQLAEATADSEVDPGEVRWFALDNNDWKPLRTGFEVVEDLTLNLTTTGIIKFSLPEGMTKINTIMPSGIYWIKAAVGKNSRSLSETIGIHAQAILAEFQPATNNDLSRLDLPLANGSIAKLLVADPNIKSVDQPYASFGGEIPELDGSYYVRVSERLRHKGRAIQKWDYERIILEKFPQIYKVKCINHSFHTDATKYTNDVPYAPGYVLLALIPDLRILLAGNSFQPKVPVSLLEEVQDYLKSNISPFVRLKAANPRYEKVNFCITVRLIKGKDPVFYTEKLKQDISELLAPWAVGRYDKLSFGQCVYRSDTLRFLEQTDYVDFITDLRMVHEGDLMTAIEKEKICPITPRSILVAGDIDVLLDPDACAAWCETPEPDQRCATAEPLINYCEQTTIV